MNVFLSQTEKLQQDFNTDVQSFTGMGRQGAEIYKPLLWKDMKHFAVYCCCSPEETFSASAIDLGVLDVTSDSKEELA